MLMSREEWDKRMGVRTEDSFFLNDLQLLHLEQNRRSIFCEPLGTHIDVADLLEEDEGEVKACLIRNSENILHFLRDGRHPKARFISLCCQNSIAPIGITFDDLMRLIRHQVLDASILDMFCTFGDKPSNAEAGGGRAVMHHRSGLDSFVLQYILNYPEPTKVKGEESWSKSTIRQVGVYHLQRGDKAVYAFLHPQKSSRLQQHLERCFGRAADAFGSNIVLPHLHVLPFYLNNWRWYLRAINEEFEKLNDRIMTLDLRRPASDYDTLADKLLDLQHILDLVALITSRLDATQATLVAFLDVNRKLMGRSDVSEEHGSTSELTCWINQVGGYIESSKLLEKRTSRVIKSMSMAVEMRNQRNSLHSIEAQRDLARDSAGDSATVQVVTLVTLIYLPASFVATVLGTNLFTFETSGNPHFQVSNQFWIFIVVSLPLTMITVAAWLVISRRRRQKLSAGLIRSEDPELGTRKIRSSSVKDKVP